MSFETSRSLGRAATLLILILPIISSMSFFSVFITSRVNLQASFISLLITAFSYLGYTLFLISMKGFADYYHRNAIFTNTLYGFIAALLGSIISYAIALPVLNPFLSQTFTTSNLIRLLATFLATWLAQAIFAIATGFFYKRAFDALAQESNENQFRTAGLLMLIGGVLTIIVVGGIITFVGWILAILGFFAIKPKTPQAPLTAQQTTTKRYCPKCGTPNNPDSIYCRHCGNKLT